MLRFFTLATLLLLPGTALAGATPWQEVAPGARVRLISSDVRDKNGETWIGIEIDMPDTLKTYWRVPGESGVPTELDLSASNGVEAAEINWPFPGREVEAGALDNIYRGYTVLPVRLHLGGGGATVRGTLRMGICSDICVPVQASFVFPLDFSAPDRAQGLRITQARARVPLAWDGEAEAIGPVSFDPATKSLGFDVLAKDVDVRSLIADVGDPAIIFGSPQKSPISGAVSIPLLSGISPGDLKGRTLHLSFMTPDGAYEVTRGL